MRFIPWSADPDKNTRTIQAAIDDGEKDIELESGKTYWVRAVLVENDIGPSANPESQT